MNSYQFCQTQEWKDYRDRKWRELYNMENDSNWMDTEEWIAAGCPALTHPKWSGNYIKCAYCGWYHDISDEVRKEYNTTYDNNVVVVSSSLFIIETTQRILPYPP